MLSCRICLYWSVSVELKTRRRRRAQDLDAAVELKTTGWVGWVDRCLPGEGSLLSPQRLPFEADALPSLRPWLEALLESLTERAEEAAQERSLSQQSQQ
jgi:hypothetical protein